ncbi:ATP-binding protein [Catenovulum agarivorans]|uniref:ATP-binding protein n=1 Tax=Catenovulum agarivorans TaxID=1172192 RepID=UPI0002FACBE3|nr:ATP-binding protein [Catenovulum agarivorans]
MKLEKDTVGSLIAAFNAAPSSELAKLICLNLDQVEDKTHAAKFSQYIQAPISNDELSKIQRHFLADFGLSSIEHLYDLNNPQQSQLKVEAYINCGQFDRAKTLYMELVEANPELKNPQLESLLSIPPTKERPKLKVIEAEQNVVQIEKFKGQVTNFSSVVGLTDVKKQIHKKIILPYQKPSIFQRFKKKVGGGVILYGPPGCGKTLLARATAGECKANFYNIEISDVLDMFIGQSEGKLHDIFEKARQNTPCVLFFDELEALASKREFNKNSAHQLVSQFLTELDGFEQKNNGVLVLASTNVPWSIDSAFMRPGRFDRMFFIPPPDKEARLAILKHYLEQKPFDSNIELTQIAAKTSGYSGADLENLIEMAADEAIDETLESGEEVQINQQHLSEALKQAKPSTIEWLTTAKNYAKYANDGGKYDQVLEFIKKHGK